MGVGLSIITVCLNSEKTIRKAIESVLVQSYKDYEFIIVDGGSSDDTLNIIKEYEPAFEGRLRWISEKDDGIYFAMNKGIELAKGEMVAFLNSDDWYEDNTFNIMMSEYKGEKYKIQYGMSRMWDENLVELEISMIHHNVLMEKMINHQACFFTKGIFELVGNFDTSYRIVADHDLMIRARAKKEVIFEPVYEIVVNFRRGGLSSSYKLAFEYSDLRVKYGTLSRFHAFGIKGAEIIRHWLRWDR